MSLLNRRKERKTTRETVATIGPSVAYEKDKSPSGSKKAWIAVLFAAFITLRLYDTEVGKSSKSPSPRDDNNRLAEYPPPPSHRFPSFGSLEFSKLCPWSIPQTPINQSCIFHARLRQTGSEGVSDWTSRVAEAHQFARQVNCRLVINYYGGKNSAVKLDHIFQSKQESWEASFDNFTECGGRKLCFEAPHMFHIGHSIESISNALNRDKPLKRLPILRGTYINAGWTSMVEELQPLLPRYDTSSALACSLEALFEWSPSILNYEPKLFQLLTLLRRPQSLVLSVYIRTHRADNLAEQVEKKTPASLEKVEVYQKHALPAIKCAAKLEQEYLQNHNGKFDNVIWMVLSDSLNVKRQITQKFDGTTIEISSERNSTTVPRSILTTSSRGFHTRPTSLPNTTHVAEALVDLWLLGEGELVIQSNSVSFGATGARRTMRPVYDAYKCNELKLTV